MGGGWGWQDGGGCGGARDGGGGSTGRSTHQPPPPPASLLLPHPTPLHQVLDWTFYLGLAPPRFASMSGFAKYFAMARGAEGAPALDMSKFFDTNYHYMVPELDAATLSAAQPEFTLFLDRVKRGQAAVGKEAAVPIIIGPNTLAGLAKPVEGATLDKSAAVAALVPHYEAVLKELKALGVPEVQMHEPILTHQAAGALRADFEASYEKLAAVGVPLNLVTYYDDIGDAYSWAVQLPVAAVSLDFLGVPGSAHKNATASLIEAHGFPAGKRLGAGVVDGRSVWADGGTATTFVAALLAKGIDDISVQSSVSLQHLPYDVALEKNLPAHLNGRLAFAAQKVKDIVQTAADAPSAKAVPLADALAPVANPVADIEPAKFVRELVSSRLDGGGEEEGGEEERRERERDQKKHTTPHPLPSSPPPPFLLSSLSSSAATPRSRPTPSPPRPSGRSPRRPRSAARASPSRRGSCRPPTTRRRSTTTSSTPSPSRSASVSTSWCTASPSAPTWWNTLARRWTASPSPTTGGSSRTGRATCAPPSSTATCPARPP